MGKVYQIVTDEILKQLDAGVIPWRRPWRTEGAAMNYVSRREYTGINRLLLAGGEYLTFNQVKELGGTVKKGSKASKVVFFKTLEAKEDKNDPDEDSKRIPFMRYYNVFGLHQVEGIESKIEPQEPYMHDPIEGAETIMQDYISREGIKLVFDDPNRAFYRPSEDMINLPELGQYEVKEEYYSTAFHEMAHSTGHKARCSRGLESMAGFGSMSYSKEELTAEIASAYLAEFAGLDLAKTIGNTAAYIDNWARALKADPKLIVQGAAASEKACSYILGRE